jgi:hypothetical protein
VDYRASKVADLPLFNGDCTDAIKAQDFVRKVDAAKAAMRWDNGTTAVHFKASLRGKALEWVKAKEFKGINVDDWEAILRPLFIKDYVEAFEEINTLTTISNLSLRPDETPRDFENRICSTFAEIQKARPLMQLDFPANPADRTEAWAKALMNRSMTHDMLYIMKCLFVSGLPNDYQTKIIERKPVDLEATVDIAQQMHKMKNPNSKPSKISEVADTKFEEEWTKEKIEAIQDPDIKEAVITAIQRRQNGSRQNYSGQNQNYSGQNYSGQNQARQQPQQQRQGQNSQGFRQNNQNQNRAPVSCYYCKRQYHIQANCRIRLEKNAPYKDAQGRPMNTPGTPEFSAWKSELQAKGKNVMIINANSENTINSLNY